MKSLPEIAEKPVFKSPVFWMFCTIVGFEVTETSFVIMAMWNSKNLALLIFGCLSLWMLMIVRQNRNNSLSPEICLRVHWLHEYIAPIYSDPNLEAAMKEAEISIAKKKDYFSVFPTYRGDLDIDIARDLLAKLKQCRCSNIDKYIEYCLQIVEDRVG